MPVLFSKRNWKITAFNSSNRFIRRLYSLILALHQGFWLGLLSNKSLVQLVDSSYQDWNSYRSHEYLHTGLWPWEKFCLDKYFLNLDTVLIGAAGGGREIFALHRMGLKIDAFDCNQQLGEVAIDELTRENIKCRYIITDPDHVPENVGIYDGLIMGWAGYSHIVGSEKRINFLKEFRQHVRTDGPILLSFFARKDKTASFSITYSFATIIRRMRLSKEQIEYGDTLIETFLHYSDESEIEQELSSAGFKLVYYSDQGFGHLVARAT